MGKGGKKPKKDGATTAPEKITSLTALYAPEVRKGLQDGVKDQKKTILESERVFTADTAAQIHQVIAHVKACEDVFVTADHPDRTPPIPGSGEEVFETPFQRTDPRLRVYYLDREGILRALDIEVRQEIKKKNGIKQTTKVGRGGTEADPTLDRFEQASMIHRFGFNMFALHDQHLAARIDASVKSIPKPVLYMVSQRYRFEYHPEGNPDELIEIALEPIHKGQTLDGFIWGMPKIDIEIKNGPDQDELRHALLKREEERLLNLFPFLKRQLHSSPTPGFNHILGELEGGNTAVIEAIDEMDPGSTWWQKKEGGQVLLPVKPRFIGPGATA